MTANVVEILVKGTNDTKGAFGEAKAGADEAAGSADELAAAQDKQAASAGRAAEAQARYTETQKAQAEAAARLKELQDGDTASTDELAAATNALTDASLAAADARKDLARVTKVSSDEQVAAGVKAEESGGLMAGMGGKVKLAMLGVAVGMGLAVKSGMDFQQESTKWVTSAGESASQLGMLQQGVLKLSAQTATSSSQLASGLYMISSAGITGAGGLSVLKAAAEGAKSEGADLSEVTNALTSGINAYGMKTKTSAEATVSATSMMNQMLATVSAGKMTFQELASSLSAVLPIAAANKISYAQVGGALATMTSMGVSARQGTQDLAFAIRSLGNPTSVATNEMSEFGISSTDVSSKLGSRGLTGTISYLSDAITSKMGKSGLVLVNSMNQSKAAAADAATMLGELPKSIQGVAKAYLDGKASYTDYNNALKGAGLQAREMGSQFATVAGKAHGFNALLASGSPAAQTYAAAMAKMLGGATGLSVGLMLTGAHAKTFDDNVASISAHADGASGQVSGFSDVTKETSFQLEKAGDSIKAAGTELGLTLLPAVSAILTPLSSMLAFIAGNKVAAIAFATVVGGVLAGAVGTKAVHALKDMKSAMTDVANGAEKVIGRLFGVATASEAEAGATAEATEAQEGFNLAMLANPVTLVVIAIAALAAGFYELWTHFAGFRDFFIGAWRDIEDATDVAREGILKAVHWIASAFDLVTRAIGKVLDWARAHWKLLVAIILGPVGLIIDALATHWSAIEHGFEAAFRFVSGVVSKALDFIKDDVIGPYVKWSDAIFRAGWDAVKRVFQAAWDFIRPYVDMEVRGIKNILSWFAHLGELFRGWWDDAVRAVSGEIDKMIHFVESIPGRVNSALGGLPGMMFRAGIHVITNLIDGAMSQLGNLGSAIGGIAGKVAGFFGLSPAKEGPLSGGGAPFIRGQHFVADIAQGMMTGLPGIRQAVARVAGTASLGGGGGMAMAGAGGGQQEMVLRYEKSGDPLIDAVLEGLRVKVRSIGGGGPTSAQRTFGRTW